MTAALSSRRGLVNEARLSAPSAVSRVSALARTHASAAWSARGTSSGQDHSGWAGIMEANEQVISPPLPCDRHPAASHPLRDLPPHRGVPARQPQRGPYRALPPRPSRSPRRPIPVAFPRLPALPCGYRHRYRLSRTTLPEPGRRAPAVTECGHPSLGAAHRTADLAPSRSWPTYLPSRIRTAVLLRNVRLYSLPNPICSHNGGCTSWRRASDRKAVVGVSDNGPLSRCERFLAVPWLVTNGACWP